MADEPIDEQNYLHGVNVIDFGDVRVMRGRTRREYSTCEHRALSYDPVERRVWCRDCEKEIDNFDAVLSLINNYHKAYKYLEKQTDEVLEAQQYNIKRIATKRLDKSWQSRTTVPCCPHCKTGLLPGDFTDVKIKTVSKELEKAKRNKIK